MKESLQRQLLQFVASPKSLGAGVCCCTLQPQGQGSSDFSHQQKCDFRSCSITDQIIIQQLT